LAERTMSARTKEYPDATPQTYHLCAAGFGLSLGSGSGHLRRTIKAFT
jgi:hypothetical protein